MFKNIFTKLCNEKGIAPTTVCQHIGLSNAAYSCWDENTVPRKTTLLKLADYFDVTVDYLLGKTDVKEKPRTDTNPTELIFPSGEKLSEDENIMITTYRHLNNEGKKKAAEYISDLAGNPNYSVDDKVYYLPSAAFEGKYPAENLPYTEDEIKTLLNPKKIDGEDF